jgi:U4/U6 small nuclear ribonucleoprotein PRP31
MAESSLAADLLADFNDDEEEVDENGTSEISNDLTEQPNGRSSRSRDLMELDGDEEDNENADEEMTGIERGATPAGKGELSIDDDEETTKAKVESMHLVDVDDVRSVAGLMKVLEPVLEVSAVFLTTAIITDSRLENQALSGASPDLNSSGECRR